MRKVYLALIAGSIIGLASGCTTHAQPAAQTKHSQNIHAPYTFTAMNGEAMTLTLMHGSKPIYPKPALKNGLQGCVRVSFLLDSHGRPTHLQVAISQPKGVFDRSAVRSMAKWRYSLTDTKGEAAQAPGTAALGQPVIYSLRGFSSRKATSLINWICKQPYARSLIVTRAAATAIEPLRILSDNKKHSFKRKHVNRVLLAVPKNSPLPNGWVDVKFCVNSKAVVTGAKVTSASPKGLYDTAALAALKTWSFSARDAPGFGKVGTCGIREHIPVYGADFLAKSPAVLNQRPTALQSADLWPKGTRVPASGKVTLTFCVEADGSVDHVKVTQAKPSAVFDEAARKVLTVWQYWPRMINGKPVATCNIQTSIQFRHTHQRLLWAESAS